MEKLKTKIPRIPKKRTPKIKKHEENGSDEEILATLKIDMNSEEEQDSDPEAWIIESVDEKEYDFLKQYSENGDAVHDNADIADSGEGSENSDNETSGE